MKGRDLVLELLGAAFFCRLAPADDLSPRAECGHFRLWNPTHLPIPAPASDLVSHVCRWSIRIPTNATAVRRRCCPLPGGAFAEKMSRGRRDFGWAALWFAVFSAQRARDVRGQHPTGIPPPSRRLLRKSLPGKGRQPDRRTRAASAGRQCRPHKPVWVGSRAVGHGPVCREFQNPAKSLPR